MFDDGVFSTIDVPFTSVSTQVSGINDFGEFLWVYISMANDHTAFSPHWVMDR
jgi:hypothetical protein